MLLAIYRKTVEYLRSHEIKWFAMSFVPLTFALMLQLLTFILLGRRLGPSTFGVYSALTAVTSVLAEVVGFGGGDILVRAIIQKPQQFSRYYGNALILLALTLPFVVLDAFSISFYLLHVTYIVAPLALFLFSEILSSRIAANTEVIFTAKKAIISANIMRIVLIGSRFLLAIGFFSFGESPNLSTWLLLCVAQSSIITCFYYFYVIHRYGKPEWKLVNSNEIGTGLLFCAAQTSRASQGNIDRAFLAAFSMGPILGSYAAASRLIQLGLFPIQIVNRILYPQFFAHGAKGIAQGRRFAFRCAPLVAGVGVISGAAVALVGHIIPNLLGHGFGSARSLALTLSVAVPIMALQYPAADALTGSGRQATRTMSYIVSALSFGVCLVIGAQLGGARGLANAYVIGQAGIAAILWTMLMVAKDEATELKPA